MTQNPLRLVYIFFAALCGLNIFMFQLLLVKGNTLTEILTNRSLNIIGLCLCISVVVCYFQENILAWWIALFYAPVMLVGRFLDGNDFAIESVLVFVVIYCFAVYYLKLKYAAYKQYINRNAPLETLEPEIENGSDSHTTNQFYDSQNPLNIFFLTALILWFIAFLTIITEKVSIADSQSIFGYFYQAIKLSIIFIFCLCYWKKSLLAWWVALLYGPILWAIYFIFRPFQITIIVPLFAYAVVIWYLIVKYRPYKSYITKQDIEFENKS